MSEGQTLNSLNRAAGTSTASATVPVMRLVGWHRPQNEAQLEQLISGHRHPGCSCGVVSTGTLEDFGRRLFEAQAPLWGRVRFTEAECVAWQRELFLSSSLRGARVEAEAMRLLTKAGFEATPTDSETDRVARVDIDVSWQGRRLCGVQVKPTSYLLTSAEVQAENKAANLNYDGPVVYLYYHPVSEVILEFDAVLESLGGALAERLSDRRA